MRQSKNDDIVPIKNFRSGVFHHKVGKLRNMRHMLAKLVPNGRMPGHARHFEIWMGREDTEGLASRISGRAGHGYCVFGHSHVSFH